MKHKITPVWNPDVTRLSTFLYGLLLSLGKIGIPMSSGLARAAIRQMLENDNLWKAFDTLCTPEAEKAAGEALAEVLRIELPEKAAEAEKN